MKTCRICGCDEQHACKGGCFWVEDDLCSQCQEKLDSYQISVMKGYYVGNGENVITLDPLILADELTSKDEAIGFIYGYIEAKNEYDLQETLEYVEDPQPSKYYTIFIIENIEDKAECYFEEVE
jgi:hypothetical protein